MSEPLLWVDARTMALLVGLNFLVLGLLTALYRRHVADNRALTLWIWAKVLTGLGIVAIVLRPSLPLALSVHGGSSLIIAGLTLELLGHGLYTQGRWRWRLALMLCGPGLVAFNLAAAATLGGAETLPRTLASTLTLAALTVTSGLVLLRSRTDRSPVLCLLAGSYLLVSLVLLVRAVGAYIVGGHAPHADLPANQALFLAAFILALVNGVSFLLLLKEDADAELRQLVTTDPLTRLANRRAFVEKSRELIELGRRSGSPVSLLMLDLDHFKAINDTHGHAAGDIVLKRVAQEMRGELRSVDLCGRIGGEEFAMVLPGARLDEAASVAERVRRAVEATGVEVAGAALTVTISVGVAEIGPADSFDRALSRADEALYGAKAAGRNRVVLAGVPPIAAKEERARPGPGALVPT